MMDENVISIKANTVFEHGDIKIGVANIRFEEYTQQNGAKSKGYTARIYIYHLSDEAQDRSLRVYSGFKDVIAGYDIEVVDVIPDVVKLKIQKSDE